VFSEEIERDDSGQLSPTANRVPSNLINERPFCRDSAIFFRSCASGLKQMAIPDRVELSPGAADDAIG
jgi:hypothetical protein